MKRFLIFAGLLALFFASSIRGVVEGSFMQPVAIVPMVMPVLLNEPMLGVFPATNEVPQPMMNPEVLRLAEISA